MIPDKLFSICNTLALAGWIVLIFLPFWKNRDKYVFGLIILLLAVIYSWLILSTIDKDVLTNFGTLGGVSSLFENKTMLLAGWIHYLAFDLLVGIYILNNARKIGINHWVVAPTMLLTFLFGPFGLLLFYLLRWARTRKFFTDF